MPNVTSLFNRESISADHEASMLAPSKKELAGYIRDMLRSLGTCARHPEFKALHALIGAAESEARTLAK